MVAQVLAVAIAVGSFILFINAFTFPEIHRKSDFIWSGIGFFYALVLWVCAGRFTGGVLLGEVASVALIGWFGWQTLILRWDLIPKEQQAKVKSLGAVLTRIPGQTRRLAAQLKGLLPKGKQPATDQNSPVVEPEVMAEQPMPIADEPHVTEVVQMETPVAISPTETAEVIVECLEPDTTRDETSDESWLKEVVQTAALPVVETPETVSEEISKEMVTTEQPADTEPIADLPADEPSVALGSGPTSTPTIVTKKPAFAKPAGFFAQINDRLESILISLGLKKKHRPMVVLDRSSQPNSVSTETTDAMDQPTENMVEPATKENLIDGFGVEPTVDHEQTVDEAAVSEVTVSEITVETAIEAMPDIEVVPDMVEAKPETPENVAVSETVEVGDPPVTEVAETQETATIAIADSPDLTENQPPPALAETSDIDTETKASEPSDSVT